MFFQKIEIDAFFLLPAFSSVPPQPDHFFHILPDQIGFYVDLTADLEVAQRGLRCGMGNDIHIETPARNSVDRKATPSMAIEPFSITYFIISGRGFEKEPQRTAFRFTPFENPNAVNMPGDQCPPRRAPS